MTIYVVTAGEYSDYHIVGLYESREFAQEVHGDHCEIEEWEMNTDLTQRREGLKKYRVAMLRDGEIRSVWDYWADVKSQDETPFTIGTIAGNIISVAIFEMWAKDEQHAIKIANERRAQLIAENKW